MLFFTFLLYTSANFTSIFIYAIALQVIFLLFLALMTLRSVYSITTNMAAISYGY